MLTITIDGDEFFDEATNTFSTLGDLRINLEHSLLSISKWESKFEKPFLSNSQKTTVEILEYIKFMIVDPVEDSILQRLSTKNFNDINAYIESKQSATTFNNLTKSTGRQEVITSELIYYWMVAFEIPFSCESWHLNRLFSLIQICNIKNSSQKKMSKNDIAARNRELNAQRKARLGTTG